VDGDRLPGGRVDAALLEESAEDLYEHAPCGYLSTLPDGTIVRINQTLLDWTGYTRAALVHATRVQSLLTIGSRMYYETHYAPLLRMQGTVNEIAFEIRGADGRVLPVIVNSVQRVDEYGEPIFNRITLFNSTDRRRYERELLLARRKAEQTAKDKADLLSMLSHDIRNPLNAVMGIVQLLEHSTLSEPQRKYVQRLKSSSESILELLNRVLELSKAESGSFILEEVPFNVALIVEDVVSTFAADAERKGVSVTSDIHTDLPDSLVGDPIALRQILTNLVGNAVKFTERGRVIVTVQPQDIAADAVTLAFAISDTGIGIAASQLERILNEFTQASYETAVKFGGTGLGLAITRKLLGLYGSRVRIDSEPGRGSTFSFNLRLPVDLPSGRSTSV
jgi:PAS domain S-box-containing protein